MHSAHMWYTDIHVVKIPTHNKIIKRKKFRIFVLFFESGFNGMGYHHPAKRSFFFVFQTEILSVALGYSGTTSIDQGGLKLTEICLPVPPEC